MQIRDIYEIRNNKYDSALIEKAQGIKFSIISRIRKFNVNDDVACCCLVYLAKKSLYKYNDPTSLDIKEIINSLEDKDIAGYVSDKISQEIWNATKEIIVCTSLSILEIIPYLQDEYNSKFEKHSVPKTIGDLARKVLGIKDNMKIADICCGKGDFILDAYLDNQSNKYYGNDIYTDDIYLSKIRFELIDDKTKDNIVIKQSKIFEDNNYSLNDIKFDKIFSNYPIGIRTKDNNSMLNFITSHKEFELCDTTSSQWVFSSLIKTKLAKNGRAVVVTSNGPLFRLGVDERIRKQFVENGFIESIIALPKNLFDYISISPTMLVLGNNKSKSIRVVDASNCYEKTRRLNVISDVNINVIINSLSTDSDISRNVSYKELADNDYNLLPQRYLNNVVDFKNAVEFGSVIKSITRGAGITASELDKISSVTKTDYQYVMLSNIKGGIIDTNLPYITEIPEKYDKYCIKNNNLLLSKNGAPYKVAVAKVNDNTKVLANGNLFVIEVDEEKVNPNYLKAFFNSQEGNKLLSSLSTNGTIPSISVNDLKKALIPIPRLEKQEEIAKDFLIVEDEIKVLEMKINKCREKLVGIFNVKEGA